MDDRALDDTLEAGCRLGIVAGVGHEVFKLGIDVFDEIAPQLLQVDVAGPHDGRGILIVHERQQKVLERGVFLVALIGIGERLVQRLFKATGE